MTLKIDMLRSDYAHIKGQPFSHFYCPILFRDEEAEFVEAHIINRAFRNSSRHWTVQRKDVDNFFGSNFEADFIDIQYNENRGIYKTITDKTLVNKFHPRILVDNKQINYFFARGGGVPDHYTPIAFASDGQTTLLGLKMSPNEFLAARDKKLVMSKGLCEITLD